MSRYSYRVEKLLKETKTPSLDILLEKEGEEEEVTPAEDAKSEEAPNEEGIPEDPFDDEEAEDDEESPTEDGDSGDAEGSEEDDSKSLSSDVERLKRYIDRSQKAGEKISDSSHKYKGIAGKFFKDIDKLVSSEESISKAFESKSYGNQSIKGFLFEEEKDSQENIESSIESLEQTLNSKENQLPNPLELAKISYKYFDRFDEVDRAIYIIKLVSKYFKQFVNPDKDKVFDEFLDRFLDILQENGINIELDGSQAVEYKTAVGARTAG